MGSYTKKQVEDMVAAAREQGREEVLEARKYAGLMPDYAHRHSLRERLKKVLAETRGYVEEP